ncbi:hypothetical protein LL912_12160 [Niabella sp. CC-SYL272]|uniref:hypothetical protein n=1 Tax=Niabella agricola TaxID=2891571 RepID=UPI001F41FEF5|nr:hypothetical protein [Niabella agricola]MCF3109527.1 hypothetical protein [Niabella agricola]
MNNSRQKKALIVVGIPTLYAVVLRSLFGIKQWNELFTVMSISFLFCLPTVAGILIVYFSTEANARKLAYRIFAPWIPIFLFFFITLSTRLEGWACWMMIMPLFLLAASVGGLIGGYFKFKKRTNKMHLSALSLVPIPLAPAEKMINAVPRTYEAVTYIDIQAPAEKIWSNVTRVYPIKEAQDKGWLTKLLGLPRPVEAILNYEGIDASREARFTNGLVFHETVTEYTDKQKMVFSIKAYPHEIPSTTMDEHIVIGGKYFDVLKGTYELERLNNTTHRLHLCSRFQLTTTFNFYAGWWAKWIMKDIQNSILQIEKRRSEN